MNREFLFCAKRVDNGEWVEGFYIRETNRSNQPVTYIYQSKAYGTYIKFKVYPETVCQFTEMYDATIWEELSENEQNKFLSEWNYKENRKNIKEDWKGKRIWENDYVAFEDCKDEGYEYKKSINYARVIFNEGRWELDDFYFKNSMIMDGLYQHYNLLELWKNVKVIEKSFDKLSENIDVTF